MIFEIRGRRFKRRPFLVYTVEVPTDDEGVLIYDDMRAWRNGTELPLWRDEYRALRGKLLFYAEVARRRDPECRVLYFYNNYSQEFHGIHQ